MVNFSGSARLNDSEEFNGCKTYLRLLCCPPLLRRPLGDAAGDVLGSRAPLRVVVLVVVVVLLVLVVALVVLVVLVRPSLNGLNLNGVHFSVPC